MSSLNQFMQVGIYVLIFYWINWLFMFINAISSLKDNKYINDVNSTYLLKIYRKSNYVTSFTSLFIDTLGIVLIFMYITNSWFEILGIVILLLISNAVYTIQETYIVKHGIAKVRQEMMFNYDEINHN